MSRRSPRGRFAPKGPPVPFRIVASAGRARGVAAAPVHAPTDILIAPFTVPEKTAGAVIGIVTVVDLDLPNDSHVFAISDSRFEIVTGVFRLKVGQQIVFASEPTVGLTITATDSTGLVVVKAFVLPVIQQVVPPTNHAPTDVLLDNTTISDVELGAVVGNVTPVDPDLPNDTVVVTVDDARFVVVGGVLRLKPNQFVSHLLEPTITVALTATDAGGLTAVHLYVLNITNIPAPNLGNAIFVAPLAAGLANGSSFANAFAFTSLNQAIGLAAAAGKQVLMASHLGDYSGQRVTLSSGGINGAPVIVRGVNAAGVESFYNVVGNRASPWAVGLADGPDIFKFIAGANHLFFKNANFINCGKGCFSFTDSVSDITIDTCNGTNVRRFIENAIASPATVATVTALRVRNCLVNGYSKSFALVTYDSNNGSFENCVGDSLGQDGDHFAVGIGFEMTAYNFVVSNTTMRNNHDIITNQGPPQTFYNGDGFSGELSNHDISFVNCVASGNTDAGFDFKGANISLTDCRSFQNKANYKFWGNPVTMLRCHGYDPAGSDATEGNHQVESGVRSSIAGLITCTDCTFVDVAAGSLAVFMFADSPNVGTIHTINTSVQKNAGVPMVYDPGGTGTAVLDTKSGPTFTVVPVISAIAQAGSTTTVTPGTATGGVSNAFQWLRDGVYIDDAVSAGYTATAADIGHRLSCRQFTVDASGYMSESTSAQSAVVTASSLTNLTLPIVIGPLGVNGVLGITPGTYSGLPQPTLTYQWKANGADIGGATGTTYTLLAGDVGKTITVVETATNTAPSTLVVTSLGVGPVVSALSIAYVRPAAHGAASGVGWNDAIGWPAINSLMAAMAPGGLVRLASWDGTYVSSSNPPTITHGGTAVDPLTVLGPDEDGNQVPFHNTGGSRSPVTIEGTANDLTPATATFTSSRTPWTPPFMGNLTNPFTTTNGSAVVSVHVPAHLLGANQQVGFYGATAVGGITIAGYYNFTVTGPDDFTITHTAAATSGASGGGTVAYEVVTFMSSWNAGFGAFSLGTGASNLKLSRLDFQGMGDAIRIKVEAVLANIEIANCTFTNVRRFLEQDFSSIGATITGLYIHDLAGVGFSKACIRLRGQTTMTVIEDISLNSGRQTGDNFAVGPEHSQNATDTAMRRIHVWNIHDSTGTFWNGDGSSGELTNLRVLIEDSEFNACTDGGVDYKSNNTILRRVHSHDNKYNLKIWARGPMLVDECLLEDARKRGGSGGTLNIEAGGRSSFTDPALDLTIKNTINRFTGAPGVGIGDDDSSDDFNKICRQISDTNTYTNIIAGTDRMSEPNNLNLFALSTDHTGPVISTASTANAFNNASTLIPLTADEGCSWSIVGGADAAIFGIADASGNVCQIGQNLKMTRQPFSGANTRVVIVRATDAGGNHTDKTITVTILSAQPPYTFRCRFEGANGATTATDEGGGKAIGFVGNAQLTTTNPIQGASSLLLDGNGDYCSVADSLDWNFTGEFTVVAKFNMAVLQNGMLAAQFDSTGGSNLAWYLAVIGSELQFKYSFDGAATFSITSSGTGLATGTVHEAAVDRDETGKIRLYLDGVMKATVTNNTPLRNAAAALTIGAQIAVTPAYFSGRLDDVRIWKGFSFAASDSGYTP